MANIKSWWNWSTGGQINNTMDYLETKLLGGATGGQLNNTMDYLETKL